MVRNGIEVSIVTQNDSYMFDQARSAGWQTFGIDFARRRDSIHIAQQLAMIFANTGANIAHGHGARSGLPVAIVRNSRRPGFAYTIHGFHYKKKVLPLRVFFKEIERFCISRADGVIAVSKADLAIAQMDGLSKRSDVWEMIYNGVEVPAQSILPDSRRKYDIAFVARMHPQKNPLVLPDILLAMRPARPTMLIVGGGELETRLRQKVREVGLCEQVTFEGAMSRADALARIAQARVFVLPSYWEGLPISLVEAMRLRVPIVASDISGNREIIVDGHTGFLVRPNDISGFGRCIEGLLRSSFLRESISLRAEGFANSLFSAERQTLEHLRLYGIIARK